MSQQFGKKGVNYDQGTGQTASSSGSVISENIKVYCRLRPEVTSENISEDSKNDEDNTYLTGNINDKETSGNRITQINEDANQCTYYSASAKSEQKFRMDGFFGPDTSQTKLYDRAVRPLVQSTLEGYSATVFVYGPTGSGKTYSMMGDLESRGGVDKGIIPRVFDQLLGASLESRGQIIIKVSYLQIYCEMVTDLLDPSGTQLSIRERNGIVYVENLSESPVSSYSDVQRIIERGDANRSTASTNMNAHSSRSHAAMLIKVLTPDDKDVAHAQQKCLRESTLVLVDLAGSERSAAIAGKGYLRAEESKSINLSLSALGNCIAALSASTTQLALGASSTRKKHVPYRDSKLTRLLQGSLGGSSRTAVIVNLPSGDDNTGEILNALRFAHRCSTITVTANVRRIVDYESLYAELQKKLDEQDHRERQQQLDMDKQYESIESQEATIDALRDEIKSLNNQVEQLRSKSTQESAGKSDMKKYIDDIAAQSALDLTDLKKRYEKRISAYKAAATESAQEISELQYDIRTEREKHLASLKDLNLVNERYSEAERTFEFRVQELLTELEESRKSENIISKMAAELEAKEEKISQLEEKIYLLEENPSASSRDMVSRAQVEEMEKMFSDTVEQLVQRVLILEESKNHSDTGRKQQGGSNGLLDDSDQEDEMAYLDNPGPSLKKSSVLPPAPVRNSGNARMEPGKIRPNNSNNSSHHVGGNFPSAGSNGGAKYNSKRF